MIEYANSRPTRIIGPDNRTLTRDMLPPPGCSRWVAARKAEVVAAVESGMLTFEEVVERYGLSLEEFSSWQRAYHRSGTSGLRIAAVKSERAAHLREDRRENRRENRREVLCGARSGQRDRRLELVPH